MNGESAGFLSFIEKLAEKLDSSGERSGKLEQEWHNACR
jgi:hypothetical protein